MEHSAFDKLFTTNAPHILEKIFLSLDYVSFKKSHEVCKDWNGFLLSRSTQDKAMKILIKNREKLLHVMRWHDYNTDEVGRILSSGMVDVNCDTFEKKISFTLLICAVMSRGFIPGQTGDIFPVKQLLDAGAEVNKGSYLKMTALHHACNSKVPIKVAELLLDKGADVNQQDCWQRTPLHIAVVYTQDVL